MRRAERSMSETLALEILSAAPVMHLASTDEEGNPVLRALNGVVVDGAVAFHGAPVGEKTLCVGRPAVVSAEQIVAQIPSSWTHPERACPATTWYRSAQVHGVLEPVEEPAARAAVLQALMERFQPEGGHRPITADDPMYRAAVANLLVVRVRPDRLSGKMSLGQDKPAEVRAAVLAGLWRRGAPGDLAAFELSRALRPDTPLPAVFTGPPGATLRASLDEAHLPHALDLLRDQYWNTSWTDAELAEAHRGATAWVGATDDDGRLLATMRVVTDRVKYGWIADVAVRPDWRGRGLGRALFALLLEHPAIRPVRRLALQTRDAMRFYEAFGFGVVHVREGRSLMERVRQVAS